MPGVVATSFGANALHGGPDSRGLPNAQPVGEVAPAIADLSEYPRAELCTRPDLAQLAARYFSTDDVATVESGTPFSVLARREPQDDLRSQRQEHRCNMLKFNEIGRGVSPPR